MLAGLSELARREGEDERGHDRGEEENLTGGVGCAIARPVAVRGTTSPKPTPVTLVIVK
ncbi:MAG: hypothetical protein U0599_09220 [Vicinamibacteria bacterium]